MSVWEALCSSEAAVPNVTLLEETDPEFSGNCPLKAATLTHWDNILGPRVEHLWLRAGQQDPTTKADGCWLASHTLNGEILRSAPPGAVDVKLYELAERDALVASLVFDAQWHKEPALMALALVLPLAERAFYLPLHAACTARLAHTVRRLRILLQKESKQCINLLTVELQSLVQQFVSLKRFGVSPDIVISNTFLGENLEDPRKRDFLHKAISSHLQTCGCSIIVGSDVERVNKMVKTLCLFLSPMERRSSRLAVSPMQGNYEAGLYVQGLLKDSSGTVTLPFRRLVCAPLPSSLVDVDPPGEVRQTPPVHEHHMRREQFFHAELACSWHNQQQLSLASGTDNLNVFQEVRWSDPLVGSFVAEVSLVSDGAGQRMLLAQFILMLQRKALILLEYVENETQRGKRPLRSLWQLKTDLDLTGDGTLAVVMAIAEKMRPGLHAVLFSHPQFSLPERD